MPATMEKIGEFLESPDWTDAREVDQFRLLGDFQSAVDSAIKTADDNNLRQLGYGFPNQVEGFKAWNRGDFGAKTTKGRIGDLMGRKAANKRIDALVMFFLNLDETERIEAIKTLLDYALPATTKAPVQPKKVRERRGDQTPPLQSHVVT